MKRHAWNPVYIKVIRYTTRVSSTNFTMVLYLCVATQQCVYIEFKRMLKTQPWGAPVFRVRVLVLKLPTSPSAVVQLKSPNVQKLLCWAIVDDIFLKTNKQIYNYIPAHMHALDIFPFSLYYICV